MRSSLLALILAAAFLSSACGSSDQTNSTKTTQSQQTTRQPSQATAPVAEGPPVSVAHGGPPPAGAPSGGPDTSALDKKIEQAEAKAKASGASPADKTAAAAAYVERGNVFYNAGQPTLYKFALRDFRKALRLDSNNAEARAKQDQIVEIYQSMGRPVPDLGNEP
ncbi:MAG: hypothetical protein QOJ64_1866 [Acidobacteriota bacterium]|jgi:hypothetical protein|nr:hypothetical protein [Acidobacteriota bacterium]